MTITSLYVFQHLLYVNDNLNIFVGRSDVHSYLTRNRNTFDVPFARLSRTKGSFEIMSLRIANKMPSSIFLLSRKSFKKLISDWLVKHPFYNIDENFNCRLLFHSECFSFYLLTGSDTYVLGLYVGL